MSALPKTPGPCKVDISLHARELFEIEKIVMADSKYLYQFKSFEEFVRCLTVDYRCDVYLWNSQEGEHVGFFVRADVPGDIEADELLLIVVLPRFQGQSYGRKMMDFYFDLVKNKKKRVVYTHEKMRVRLNFMRCWATKLLRRFRINMEMGRCGWRW